MHDLNNNHTQATLTNISQYPWS